MFTIEAKNLMLNAFAGSALYLGLTDENGIELTVAGYARQSIAWGVAENGIIECQNQFNFNLPPDTQVNTVIFMSALTGGIKLGEREAEGIITYTVNGVQADLDGA